MTDDEKRIEEIRKDLDDRAYYAMTPPMSPAIAEKRMRWLLSCTDALRTRAEQAERERDEARVEEIAWKDAVDAALAKDTEIERLVEVVRELDRLSLVIKFAVQHVEYMYPNRVHVVGLVRKLVRKARAALSPAWDGTERRKEEASTHQDGSGRRWFRPARKSRWDIERRAALKQEDGRMSEPRGCPIPGACSALARIAELERQLAEARETVTEMVGCFDAAEVEGLSECLRNLDIDYMRDRLRDVMERRVLFGYRVGQDFLARHATRQGEHHDR